MTEEQMRAFEAKARALSERMEIGMEAAALIVELHDVAQAFHRVADAMGKKPVAYEMREVGGGLFDGDAPRRTLFIPVEPDA